MQKTLWFLFAAFVCMPALAGVGRVDNREYVDWSTPPYNKIVYFESFFRNDNDSWSSGHCTAQYVAPDIILTARHCVTHTHEFDNYELLKDSSNCLYKITLHNGKSGYADLEKYGYDTFSADWALLRVQNSELFSNDYFDVVPRTEYTTIDNAGFGYMRILSDYDVQQLRQFAKQYKKSYGMDTGLFLQFMAIEMDDNLKEKGMSPLLDINSDTGKYRLKAHRGCRFVKRSLNLSKYKRSGTAFNLDSVAESTCDTFSGNSGGAFFVNDILYGIDSWGSNTFDNRFNRNHATKTELFYDALQEMKKTSPTMQNNGVIMGHVNDNVKTDIPNNNITDITAVENHIQAIDNELSTKLDDIDTMSDAEFVVFLDKLTEYQVLVDRYNQARQNQQSTANKTLTALTVAATGIGGMMLAQGASEQNADAAAESDMRAFLGTFRCDYGAGKNIMGGDVNVELPGINALTPLVTEYISLASDLKSRKAALGMPPGIESDVLMDTAATGLYDNESTGITDGHYTSVSRALTNPNGRDADELAAQKQKTKTKTTVGGVIGGTGLVGGAIGNAIINRDKK